MSPVIITICKVRASNLIMALLKYLQVIITFILHVTRKENLKCCQRLLRSLSIDHPFPVNWSDLSVVSFSSGVYCQCLVCIE